ncbi:MULTISPECIES: alginate export family protein [Rhodonellum]|nr:MULTISPECIES: alginate export family protein [Rhodonellum]SDZ57711.1 Alginate export [Rhodonellum ikkaensis]
MRTSSKAKIGIIVLVSLLRMNFAFAQFSLSGEIRPRAELRHGFKSPLSEGASPAFFIEQRSRINFSYKMEALTFHLSAQDVRIWGNTAQIYKTDPALTNLYEAWAAYQISSPLSIKIGRQALDYDNARFLGDLDWAQQGRSHDLVLLKFQDSLGTQVHLGAAFNQNVPFEPGKLTGTHYEGLDNYKAMQFLWFHKKMKSSKFSVLLLNDGRQKLNTNPEETTVYFRQTYGFIGSKKLLTRLDGEMEIYHQGGLDPVGKKVSAWLYSGSLTYNTGFIPLTFGYDYLSGTGPGTTQNNSFNPLYGTNHKFYGLMDYFYVGNNHGQGGRTTGLNDFFFKTNIPLNPKNKLLLHFHHFSSPELVYADAELTLSQSQHLGKEIDLVWNAQLSKEVAFTLGYSQMFATSSLSALKGGGQPAGLQYWAWAMIAVKPDFLGKK